MDHSISLFGNLLSLLPRSDPRRRKCHYVLGWARYLRHESSGQDEDLDQSILHLTEAILLPFPGFGIFRVYIVEILFRLASTLSRRSQKFKRVDDADFAVKCLYCLRGQPLDKFGIQRNEVTISLIEMLAIRAISGSSDGMQDIEAMITISGELLDLDIPEKFAFRVFGSLTGAIYGRGNGNRRVLDHCITQLREARICRQNSPPALSLVLAYSLGLRFVEVPSDDDFEEGTIILNGFRSSLAPENSLDGWQLLSLPITLQLATIRASRYEKLEYAEETISHIHTILHSSFTPNSRPQFIEILGRTRNLRFRSFGVEKSSTLQEALSLSPEVTASSSSKHLEASPMDSTESHSTKTSYSMEVDTRIRHLQEHLSTTPSRSFDHRQCLEKLVILCHERISLTNDPADLVDAIKYCRLLLDSTSPGELSSSLVATSLADLLGLACYRTENKIIPIEEAIRYGRLLLDLAPPGGISSSWVAISLANLLRFAFERTDRIEDFNESVDLLTGILGTPAGQVHCGVIVDILIAVLLQHIKSLRNKHQIPGSDLIPQSLHQLVEKHLQTVVEIRHLAVENKYMSAPNRLSHSCRLAQSLRHMNQMGIRSLSISAVYEKAMSLMQDSIIFAPNVQLQHTHLVAMILETQTMPLDYASHLVHSGQFEQAIEVLERGRALLWSELRGLRTSIHHISGADPLLAEKFTAINREVEKLAMSVLLNQSPRVNDDGAEDDEFRDPFGRLLVKQRKLLEERDGIISQIRSLPGLQNFLMPPSFDTLRSAALRGPVIIINHCSWRSDILILLYEYPPALISTSKGFYAEANRLKRDLLDARNKHGLDSMDYNQALAVVLEDLYNLVGQPVIDRLHELNIPEQSRVWWCPTSVFCSLPLHAMGPIPSNDGTKRYFSDLYIPSYTPTLSALIESRQPSTQQLKQPSLLLVAQPDRSLPGVKGEIKVIQHLDIEVESLILRGATTASVLESLKHHKLVHFACHGHLEVGKPFDASFKLYGGDYLKLLDIVHSRLPTAEFAFLSACHTAELTEESIADEGLHLTAALQYCGFRSVVGTMWAMADTDGRDLARHLYQSMLSGSAEEPCYLRSAEALRDAVTRLRRMRGVTLERWVNFVHYGA